MKNVIIMLLDSREMCALCRINVDEYYIGEFEIIKAQNGIAGCTWIHVLTDSVQTAYNIGRIMGVEMHKNLKD